jgi:hypothetical protein
LGRNGNLVERFLLGPLGRSVCDKLRGLIDPFLEVGHIFELRKELSCLWRRATKKTVLPWVIWTR